MENLWRDLPASPDGEDSFEIVNVIVEITRGSRNKFEYDKEWGTIKLDRVLYSSIVYPGDYGLIPHTHYDDGDPLDILVMVNVPTFAGCVIEARPVGVFHMLDKGEPDDKILAVPNSDPLYGDIHKLADVPSHFLREVEHFFSVYKDLEGARVEPRGWDDVEVAYQRIDYAVKLYYEKFGKI
ncbi:MAG: inorganic diphosphatase [Chloroflexi bacterium]|nr:inorganic diphosphatase [Chloroflexota bacterium]